MQRLISRKKRKKGMTFPFESPISVQNFFISSKRQTKICSKLAKDFDSISVREYSTIALCKNYLNVDAIDVLDPTLLLEKDQYMTLCDESILKSNKKFLAVYILDMTDSKRLFIEKIADDKNL